MRASLSLRRSFSIFLRNRVSNANSSVGCPIVVSPRAAGLLWPPPVVWGKTRGAAVYQGRHHDGRSAGDDGRFGEGVPAEANRGRSDRPAAGTGRGGLS